MSKTKERERERRRVERSRHEIQSREIREGVFLYACDGCQYQAEYDQNRRRFYVWNGGDIRVHGEKR